MVIMVTLSTTTRKKHLFIVNNLKPMTMVSAQQVSSSFFHAHANVDFISRDIVVFFLSSLISAETYVFGITDRNRTNRKRALVGRRRRRPPPPIRKSCRQQILATALTCPDSQAKTLIISAVPSKTNNRQRAASHLISKHDKVARRPTKSNESNGDGSAFIVFHTDCCH